MANPTGVSIAFEDSALVASPTWTDINPVDGVHVTGWSISRGRQSELDKTGTGTATVEIVDLSGALDPTNPFSPFANNLDPMKQAAIAIRSPVAPYGWHTLFRGFVAEWLYDFDPTERIGYVTLELVDAFDLFSHIGLTPGIHGELGAGAIPAGGEGDIWYLEGQQFDDRINKLLNDANWPSALRRIFSGNVALQGYQIPRRDSLLSALQDTTDGEFPSVSNIYMDKEGKVTAHGRFARFNPSAYTSHGVLHWYAGDVAAANGDSRYVPITGLSFRRSQNDIRNACLALPKGIDEFDVPGSIVKDDDSIAAYGFRMDSFTDLLTLHGDEGPDLNAVQETKLFADYYVSNYKAPRSRVTTIRFKGRDPGSLNGNRLWQMFTLIDISHVVSLRTTHSWPGGVGGFDEDFYVEGVRWEARPLRDGVLGGWSDLTLELDVSPTAYYDVDPFTDPPEA